MINSDENLKTLIELITNNEIVLPDFQRQFEWDLEKQRGLVASVLTRLPVGGILLLNADASDYKCKNIGIKTEFADLGKIPPKTLFLLDGQQRMTCLANVFSDIIHESSKKQISHLSARSLLAVRYYLAIDKWNASTISKSQKDIFGIRTLDFRFDVSKNEEPDFLTADIIDHIEYRTFYASDYGKKPYAPCQKYNVELDDYCFQTADKYLIPLFLLIGTNAKDSELRNRRLNAIIKRMTQSISEAITTHHGNLEDDQKEDFAFSVILDEDDRNKYTNSSDKQTEFENLVEEKIDLWKIGFLKYLNSCVEKLKINKIEMPEGSRARAIDIYENMNMGGLSLSTFDLVAARVAKVSQESLYDRIVNNLTNNKDYNKEAIPVLVGKFLPEDYNASLKIGAVVDKKATKMCSDLFLEVLGLFCNNLEQDPNEAKCIYSKSSEILQLKAEQINDNCEKVCLAIDRAFCFLQVRCGIRNISEVNYKVMMRLIAFIFTNDEMYKDKAVHDKLEAWYWSAVFSGEYDKDQNDRYESNLKNMLESLQSTDYSWIAALNNNTLNTPYFSDCEFLLMGKASEERVPKEHLARYFCQYFLQKVYSDLITDDKKVNVFTEALEKHHIIPLGSVANIGESTETLREDKQNILNSPLNFVYITDKTNIDISDKSLEDYQNAITALAKSSLCIHYYPSVTDLDKYDKVKQWLKDRHETIKGEMQNHINLLLNT